MTPTGTSVETTSPVPPLEGLDCPGAIRAIFNSLAVGVAILSPEARFLQVNEAFCAMTGHSEAELKTVDCAALTHPDDCPVTQAHIAELLSGERSTFVIEKRYRKKDGRIIWVQNNVSMMRDPDGRPTNIIALCHDVTERKQTEEALRESQTQLAMELADTKQLQKISAQLIQEENVSALYQQIVDAAIAVMRSDMGSMQMFHPDRGALKLLAWRGFHPESAAFWEWVQPHSTSKGRSGTTCGVAFDTGHRLVVEDIEMCEFMTGTADLAAFRQSGIRGVQSTPLVSRSGRVLGMISTHWREPHQPSERNLRLLDVVARQAADLLERKLAEEAVRESEARLKLFIEHAPAAIAMFDRDMRYVAASRRWMSDLHLGDQNLIGRSQYDVFPEIPDRWRAVHRRCLAGAIEKAEEDQFVRSDGSVQWFRWEVRPWHDTSGGIGGIVIFAEDISERKRAEAALRRSETQFRQLADALPHLVWTARSDGFIDYYNERWYEYTAFPRDSFGEQSWEPLLHPDDVQRCKDTYYGCIQSGRPYQIEYRFKDRKTGGYRWFLGRAYPVRDDVGSIVRWFGTCTDIDDTKRAEEALEKVVLELKASKQDLQEKVEELEGFHDAVVGRELKMMELERELQRLRASPGDAAQFAANG